MTSDEESVGADIMACVADEACVGMIGRDFCMGTHSGWQPTFLWDSHPTCQRLPESSLVSIST